MPDKTDNYDPLKCKYKTMDCQTCIHYIPSEFSEDENQWMPDDCDQGMV